MDARIILYLILIAFYSPFAGVLLYVWWKHGKEEAAVSLARSIFLAGSFAIFGLLLFF